MIIFINGSINAGKTTVAKLLVNKIPSTALVEIDIFHAMIEWMPIDKSVPINLENAVSIIKNFLKHKINVVVPYPLSQKNYEYMVDNLKEFDDNIHFFTLSPKLEKVLTNRGTRELSEWERNRIKYHYDIGIQKPSFGEIIDNSDSSPKETAEYIFSKLRNIS